MPKKAPAKPADSKKTVQKKKQQVIDDKTFGLKNKNKSKKVQQQIKSVEKAVLTGDPKQRKLEEERQKLKVERKLRQKALKDEQDALFGEALLAVQKKKNIDKKEGKQEALGRDANDEAEKKSTSRAMKMMFQMDAQEMSDKLREDPNYIPTLEDEIEDRRQQKVIELKNLKTLTPITHESFQIWLNRKKEKRLLENRKKVQAELRRKKGGKGLGILSGRDLYEYKKDLFDDDRDDDEGVSNNDDDKDDDDGGGIVMENGNAKHETVEQDAVGKHATIRNGVHEVAAQVQSELFLDDDDHDLDDLDDDD